MPTILKLAITSSRLWILISLLAASLIFNSAVSSMRQWVITYLQIGFIPVLLCVALVVFSSNWSWTLAVLTVTIAVLVAMPLHLLFLFLPGLWNVHELLGDPQSQDHSVWLFLGVL